MPSTARTPPLSLTRNVGPQSRIQASLLAISTTRTARGRLSRAFWYCAGETQTVTGSNCKMAVATSRKAFCAGLAPSRQLSLRSGQSIQTPACGSNSAGIR